MASIASEYTASTTENAIQFPNAEERVLVAHGATLEAEISDEYCGSSIVSGSSLISKISTVEYHQEPYEAFKVKVLELILQLYPVRTAGDVRIERMKGGGFNRIIGITFYEPKNKTSIFTSKSLRNFMAKSFHRRRTSLCHGNEECILRIPRLASETKEMDYHVVTLAYLAGNVSFPIPKVISYDMSGDNPLGRGYMFQRRLPGQPLHETWHTLTLEQKKTAAQLITQIILDTNKISHEHAGIISRSNTTLDLQQGVQLETFPIPSANRPIPEGFKKAHTFPSRPQTTVELLTELCERWREYEGYAFPRAHDRIWDGFIRIIKKLHELGYIPDEDKFPLCHLDFQSRNILVEVGDGAFHVTGVLDWDSAIFAPKFLSMRAPFFMWDGDDADEDDENGALAVPEEPDKVEVKKIFEATAGAEFLRYAYKPEYLIARRMFQILLRGIHGNWDLECASSVIRDFEEMYPLSE